MSCLSTGVGVGEAFALTHTLGTYVVRLHPLLHMPSSLYPGHTSHEFHELNDGSYVLVDSFRVDTHSERHLCVRGFSVFEGPAPHPGLLIGSGLDSSSSGSGHGYPIDQGDVSVTEDLTGVGTWICTVPNKGHSDTTPLYSRVIRSVLSSDLPGNDDTGYCFLHRTGDVPPIVKYLGTLFNFYIPPFFVFL